MAKEEVVVIADPKSNVWEFTHKVFEEIKKIEKEKGEIGFVLGTVSVANFPDYEFEPRIELNARRRNVIFIHDSSKDPARWWVELMLVNDAAKRGGARRVINVLPYMRWSRADKKDKPRMPIAGKVLADSISLSCLGSRADRIITLDLHSIPMQGFFNIPIDSLYSFPDVANYIKQKYPEIIENLIVIAPDLGAADRARAFAKRLGENIDIAIIEKKRVGGGDVVAYRVIGDVEGKNCLVVDDILSSGGTLREGALALKQKNVKKIYAYVTHFVGVGNYKENLKEIEKVFVSDSFFHPQEDVAENMEIISLAPLFAETIYRAEKGDSISELFK